MSSDSRDRKRSGLAGQIEVEIIRDPQTSHGIFSASGNPFRILQELVDQMEELEQSSGEVAEEEVRHLQIHRQIARLHRQNSALKRILDKAH